MSCRAELHHAELEVPITPLIGMGCRAETYKRAHKAVSQASENSAKDFYPMLQLQGVFLHTKKLNHLLIRSVLVQPIIF